jgi:hypothetical protein
MGRWTVLKHISKRGLNLGSAKIFRSPTRCEGGLVRRSCTDQAPHEGAANLASAKLVRSPRRSEGGSTLVELSVILFVLMSIGVLCLQTMESVWKTLNWTIAQSMTDACAAIETANAQRWVFNEIVTSGRWPLYPQSSAVQTQIGSTPRGAVNVTVHRTYSSSQDPVTGLQTYTLESYVVYQDALRQYCKLSKVVRSE